MKTGFVLGLLLLSALVVAPTAEARDDPPSCYDRGPIVDGIIVEVWLTRSCQPDVRINQPSCTVGDIRFC